MGFSNIDVRNEYKERLLSMNLSDRMEGLTYDDEEDLLQLIAPSTHLSDSHSLSIDITSSISPPMEPKETKKLRHKSKERNESPVAVFLGPWGWHEC
jgi:hypothetical protein